MTLFAAILKGVKTLVQYEDVQEYGLDDVDSVAGVILQDLVVNVMCCFISQDADTVCPGIQPLANYVHRLELVELPEERAGRRPLRLAKSLQTSTTHEGTRIIR